MSLTEKETNKNLGLSTATANRLSPKKRKVIDLSYRKVIPEEQCMNPVGPRIIG